MLHLKDAYYTIKHSESSKAYCGILHSFFSAIYVYQKCLWDLAQAQLCGTLTYMPIITLYMADHNI